MFYTIYKITNIVNGKFYIGKHQTNDIDDGYMGSGKLLKRAINKYGIDNFTKEYLEVLDTEQKMNLAERIYVVTDNEVSYNLCPGGYGGFGYINQLGLQKTEQQKEAARKHVASFTLEQRAKNGKYGNVKLKEKGYTYRKGISKDTSQMNTMSAKEKRKETFKKIGHSQGSKNPNYGKPRSEETKQKIREAMLKRNIFIVDINSSV